MRRSFRRRPELERLESVALLSGFSTAPHPGAAGFVEHASQSTSPITLNGVFNGTYKVPLYFQPTTFDAAGSINPLGKFSVNGALPLHSPNFISAATFVSPAGTIEITLTQNNVQSTTYQIKITGGTGIYQGASGGGSGNISQYPKGHQGLGGTLVFTFTVKLDP